MLFLTTQNLHLIVVAKGELTFVCYRMECSQLVIGNEFNLFYQAYT